MKNTRKLIPAIAMLLISAVMMSTASFAWFSTNSVATASGMSVTVASATNILISDKADTGFASSKTFNDAKATQLAPASAVAKNDPAFFYMDTSGTGMTADSSVYGDGATFKAGTENTHYITFTSYLKVVGEDAGGRTITPTITFTNANATTTPVYSALRVLFVVDGTPYLYAPVGTPDAQAKPIEGIEDAGAPKIATSANTLLTNGTSPIVSSVVKEQVYEVDVYVWLEGQDAACTAANAINLSELPIVIDFTLGAAPVVGP